MEAALRPLERQALALLPRAYVPFSGRPAAVLLLLEDGAWIPGVRVESASFSLVIPAVLNAVTTAVAAGRPDAVALALSRPALPGEAAYLAATPVGAFAPHSDRVFVRAGTDPERLPTPAGPLPVTLPDPPPGTPADGLALARRCAERAYVPISEFPVGCVLLTADGRLVPGVNVEHDDWTRILCAERNAIGTAFSYGLDGIRAAYLSCRCDPSCTPCGACRQLLAECAPDAVVWMDRGDDPPASARPAALLPGSFSGRTLRSQAGPDASGSAP